MRSRHTTHVAHSVVSRTCNSHVKSKNPHSITSPGSVQQLISCETSTFLDLSARTIVLRRCFQYATSRQRLLSCAVRQVHRSVVCSVSSIYTDPDRVMRDQSVQSKRQIVPREDQTLSNGWARKLSEAGLSPTHFSNSIAHYSDFVTIRLCG